jgi:hypothetical protein
MRRFAIACAALCLFAATATAAEIKTGRDLVNACRDYMTADNGQDNNAARAPHTCRTFLQGFFVSLIERERARQDAMVKGLPYASKEPCVRMPDFLSYREMAGRVVTFGQNNPTSMNDAAATLAQKTLEHDFPCPPPPSGGKPS